MKTKLSPRAFAATLLVETIQQRRSLSSVLDNRLANYAKPADRGFIRELCFGVVRWYEELNAISQALISKPLKPQDQDIHALVLIGLYQLLHLQTKPHAAVHETVQAARDLQKPWAVKLLNGVLRNWQRQSTAILAKIQQNPAARYAHPAWLLKLLQAAWPNEWEAIATANNQHPPLTLRVNQSKQSRADYLQRLTEHGIAAQAVADTQAGIMLAEPQDATTLPGFMTGDVSVQDAAAQLAAELLELAPGQHILDACAAPGGKTAHILELEPGLAGLTAIDNDAARLGRITENLDRLGVKMGAVKVTCGDASQPAEWWDKQLFERILLDAPCSATGVIRRHPDIKLLRKAKDIPALATKQLELLEALWPLLKTGGLLLYVTCSVLPQENTLVLLQFLANHPDAREKPLDGAWGIAMPVGRQTLPNTGGMDGFYYAKLQKCN